MTIDEAVAEVERTIDKVSAPERMSKEDYAEFLDALMDELRVRQEATK